MTHEIIAKIEEKIGYTFNRKHLLTQAFIRSSFANENANWEDNEKLEFVGDKVLDLIVVKKLAELYSIEDEVLCQSIPSIIAGEKPSVDNVVECKIHRFTHTEGEMTDIKKQIVKSSSLAAVIDSLSLNEYLLVSKGDLTNGIIDEMSVKEDLFEAIIGAIAIDSGWNIALIETIVEKLLNLEYHIKNGVEGAEDYISLVNAWYQKEYGAPPEYKFHDSDAEGTFECYIELPGYGALFDGFGYSKAQAIRLAAQRAYLFIKENSQTRKKVRDAVGEFTLDTAVGKLVELSDKKYITGLDFIFVEEAPTEQSSGNPTWSCTCVVDGISDYICYSDTTKSGAKKAAAFTMLEIITTGKDTVISKLNI